MPNSERQIILEELSKYDDWYNPAKDSVIIEQIRWLKEKLKFNSDDEFINSFLRTVKYRSPFNYIEGRMVDETILSYRQVSSIIRVFCYLNDNEISRAFHALLEYIDNYQYTLEEPLNEYERLLIFLAINQFEFVYKNIYTSLSKNKLKNMSAAAKEKMIESMEEFEKEGD